MSFSKRCKKEVLKKDPINPKAELISLVHFIGSIRISQGQLNVILNTDLNSFARYSYKLISTIFDYSPAFEIQDNPDKKSKRDFFVIVEDSQVSEKIVKLAQEGFIENFDDIEDVSLSDIKAFLKIAFLIRGSINDPQRGYNLEIVSKDKKEARLIKESMECFELFPKLSKRSESFIIYLKDSDKISDFLAIISAMNSLFELENVRAMKSLRNDINRVNNFDNANIDRTVKAGIRQVSAINTLIKEESFEDLDALTKNIAMLRIKNPYLSLEELGEILDPPLSKAKVNYRLQKIMKIAKNIKKKDRKEQADD